MFEGTQLMTNVQHATQRCDVCGREFPYGPHAYHGQFLKVYGIMAYNTCYAANEDGWAPHLEGGGTAKLEAQGLPLPDRVDGKLPRE